MDSVVSGGDEGASVVLCTGEVVRGEVEVVSVVSNKALVSSPMCGEAEVCSVTTLAEDTASVPSNGAVEPSYFFEVVLYVSGEGEEPSVVFVEVNVVPVTPEAACAASTEPSGIEEA